MFVPNFKILSQVVSEKSLTEKKFTDRQTNKHPYGKGKNYIPPISITSYTEGIKNSGLNNNSLLGLSLWISISGNAFSGKDNVYGR